MEAGSGEKVEEFVVLHQEPSASEAISPRVARPYIQALHSINLDAQQEDQQQQQKKKKEEEEVERKPGTFFFYFFIFQRREKGDEDDDDGR